MIKRKTKLLLESKVNDLKMNLANNYKDLARDALEELQRVVEECRESGELKDKDYRKYKQIADEYAMRMMNYHH